MSSKYTKFFSQRALARAPSAIRALLPLTKVPGIISLGGGLPNPTVFPLKGISFELEGHGTIDIPIDRVKEGLQYSSSFGMDCLLSSWRKVLSWEHNKQENSQEFSIITTTGSQDGLSKCFDCLLDPEDAILVENPTYSGALAALNPTRANIVPVPSDNYGIIPNSLNNILNNWNSPKKPKALYIIPTGQNPAGTTIPADRRTEIYNLSLKHDFLIIEDDPYWFLHFQETPRPESFFSMDTEGRVLRLDSLSKVLSAGLRVGFVAGPSELIEKIQLDQQASALHSSGISQIIASSILDTWGQEGLKVHSAKVQAFYKKRRDLFLQQAEKYLSDITTWVVPEAGMFVWFECKDKNIDTQYLSSNYGKEHKIIIVPGPAFHAAPNTGKHTFRVSFSQVAEENMEESVRRLRALLLQ